MYTFFNTCTRWCWVFNATPQPLYPQKSDPVTILWESGWAPGLVWTGAENLASTAILSPDPPTRSVVAIPTEQSRPTGSFKWLTNSGVKLGVYTYETLLKAFANNCSP
jgi:hypothetical protein